MNVYIISDTHFNHKKLIEYGRPADFEDRILNNLRSIPKGSLIIHLGDFCIGDDLNSAYKWNSATQGMYGRVLVRGNHDKKSNAWHLDRGFEFVCTQFIDKYFGKRIIFSHIPVKPEDYPTVDLNIHGHTHGNSHRDKDVRHYMDPKFHREIAPEIQNYGPVLLTEKFLK